MGLVKMFLNGLFVLFTPRRHGLRTEMIHVYLAVNPDSRYFPASAPAPVAQPETEIDIFVAHEEIFIPSAQFLEDLAPDHEAKPAQYLCAMSTRKNPIPPHVLKANNEIGYGSDCIPILKHGRKHKLIEPATSDRKSVVVDEADPGRLPLFCKKVVAARIPEVPFAMKRFELHAGVARLKQVPPPSSVLLEPLEHALRPILWVVTGIVQHPQLVIGVLRQFRDMRQEAAGNGALIVTEHAYINLRLQPLLPSANPLVSRPRTHRLERRSAPCCSYTRAHPRARDRSARK